MSAVCLTLAAAQPVPVLAAYEWKPRRHHRRFGETRVTRFKQQLRDIENAVKQKQEQLAKADVKDALGAVSQGVSSIGKKWQEVVQGDRTQTITLDRSAAIRSAHRSQRPAHSRSLPSVRPDWAPQGAHRYLQPATVMGTLLVIVAAVCAALSVFGRQLGLRWRWGKQPEKGRWVRDRGLGGKLVFISDEPSSPSPAPLMSWDVDTSSLRVAEGITDPELWESLGTPETSRSGPAQASLATAPPEWWNPPTAPLLPISAARQDEARMEARRLIKALEDSKLLEGADYSIDRLTALKRVCTDVGIVVRPRADNVRDAMFRSGVEAAVGAAMTGGMACLGQLGGDSAPAFVCGLASALEVPQHSALTIVHAAIAARAKSCLTNALAAQLKGQMEVVLQELLRISNMLEAFPLPPGTPEAELVGSALLQRANLEFRQAVFTSFGCMNRRQAGPVAEMLGFDPSLVLPTLDSMRGSATSA